MLSEGSIMYKYFRLAVLYNMLLLSVTVNAQSGLEEIKELSASQFPEESQDVTDAVIKVLSENSSRDEGVHIYCPLQRIGPEAYKEGNCDPPADYLPVTAAVENTDLRTSYL
jgi:hypothetical protein